MKFTTRSPFRNRLVLLGLLILSDGIFFSAINPAGSHVSMVVLGCALAIITIYVCWSALVAALDLLHPLSSRVQRGLRWAGSAVCSFLLLMQSIGQLDWRDAIAATLLATIVYLYIVYPSS